MHNTFGDTLAALRVARAQGILGGSFFGARPPLIAADHMLFPPHLTPSGTITITGAQHYGTWFLIDRVQTFSGVKFRNSGAGDNGDKVKIAFYTESSSGGPGTLAKNFGEATLTGAAAIRTLAAPWTPGYVGWYWGVLVSDNSCELNGMAGSELITDVGYHSWNAQSRQMPMLSAALAGSFDISLGWSGEYVAGTYANFPETTPLTFTTNLTAVNQTGGANFPGFGLYV